MIRTTAQVLTVAIKYNDLQLTEHQAQEILLQSFPERVREGVFSIGVEHVERIAGGVDEDGVAYQPLVRKLTVQS